jgi:hypothetical protein
MRDERVKRREEKKDEHPVARQKNRRRFEPAPHG